MTTGLDLPELWVETNLSELVRIVRGVTYKKAESSGEAADGLLPVLRANNIQDGQLVFDDLVYVPSSSISDVQRIRRGDIVVAMSSGSRKVVGKTARALDDWQGGFGAFCGVLRPSEHVDNRYVAWFTGSREYRSAVSELAAGVNINNLKPSHFEQIRIPLPPLEEQKQIADKLDELLVQVDSIKTRLDAIPAILKRFRQSVLAAAVSGRLTEDWRGKVAHSWKSHVIGDIAIVINGKAFPSKEYTDSGVRLLRPGNLDATGKVVWTEKNSTFLPKIWAERRPELLLTAGALLMNLTAQSLKDEFLGRVCVLERSSDLMLLNQRIASFTSRLDYDVTPYLYVYFKSPSFREFVDTLDSGTLIKHMSTNAVLNHEIMLPDSTEQAEIVLRVQQLFDLSSQIEQRLTEAQNRINQITQSILAKAFRGELTADWREQHPEMISGEHSAEALLERIKAERAKLEPKKRVARKRVAAK